MATKENKDTVVRFWEEVFNRRNYKLIDQIFTDDYVYHGAGGQDVRGGEGLKQFLGSTLMHSLTYTLKLKRYSVKKIS